MDLPVSVKESYEEFCQRYQMKIKEDTSITSREIYFKACNEPLDPNLYLFIWYGKSAKSTLMQDFMQSWLENRGNWGVKVRILVKGKKQLEALQGLPEECVIKVSDDVWPEIVPLYAQAGCIVTAGSLPNFFVRRDGQRVISLYRPLEEEDDQARFAKADRRVSTFLNSSMIWVEDQSQAEQILQTEQLDELYQGKMAWCSFDNNESEAILRLLAYVFEQKEEDLRFLEVHVHKKHMIIYYSRNQVLPYFQYMKLFVNLLDYESWDVTLLCQKPKTSMEESRLLSLNSHVRIVFGARGFNSTVDEYLKQQYLLENLSYFEDALSAMHCIDTSLLLSEFTCTLGQQSFDEFFYFGKFSSIFLKLALSVPINCLRKIEIDNYKAQRGSCSTLNEELSYINRLKVYGELFDKIVFPTEELKDIAMSEGNFREQQLQVFSFSPFLNDIKDSSPYQKVFIQQKPYAVCEQQKQLFQNEYLELMPCLEEGEQGCLVDARDTDLDILFNRLKSHEECSSVDKWFIVGAEAEKLSTIAARYDMGDAMIALDVLMLEAWNDLMAYLQQFDAYLTLNENDASVFRIAMELSDKKILLCNDDGIKQLNDLCYTDINSYNKYVKQRVQIFVEDN